MRHTVATGKMKGRGTIDMTMCFEPSAIGWHPKEDPRDTEPDHDAERKRRIEDELAYGE